MVGMPLSLPVIFQNGECPGQERSDHNDSGRNRRRDADGDLVLCEVGRARWSWRGTLPAKMR